MSRNSIRPVLSGLARATALLASAAATAAPTGSDADAGAALTRGRALYESGRGAGDPAPLAVIPGGARVPATWLTCGGCHGADGRGGRERGGPVPDIRLERLEAPYGVSDAFGRWRPPYAAGGLERAVRDGVDSSGRPFDALMPRYEMSDADLADLVAYLRVLDREAPPGVTGDRVRIGALLPEGDGAGATGGSLADRLRSYFEDVNARGRVNGRRIELVVRDPGPTAETALAAVRSLSSEVAAFVANGGAGASPEVGAYLDGKSIPSVGPLTFVAAAAPSGSSFHVLPVLDDQARAAAAFLARDGSASAVPVAVLAAEGAANAAAAAAFAIAAREAGLPLALPVAGGASAAAERLARLALDGVDTAVVFGSAIDARCVVAAAEETGWRPRWVFFSVLCGGCPVLPGRRVVCVEPLPRSSRDAGAVLDRAALLAARTLVEALERAGRDVDRPRLVQALRDLGDFRTEDFPPLHFGPARRLGLRGAGILSVTGDGSAARGEWIDAAPRGAAPVVGGEARK